MSTDFVRTLRPGYLVNMRTSVGGGNVQYSRRDVEALHVDENGVQVSRWETERTVVDPAELADAIKIRGKARGMIVSVCSATSFGLLCPTARRADLDAAVMAARKLCWDFNATAKNTQIAFNVIYGQVAQDDVQAVEAISLELRDLVATMEAGAAELDVKKIRDAAQKMRNTGQMLSPSVQLKVDEIVKAARDMAKKMVKAGEAAAAEVDDQTMAQLRAARTSFLDLDAEEATDDDPADHLAEDLRAAGTRAVDFDAWEDWGTEPEDDEGDQGAQAAAEAQDTQSVPGATGTALDMDGWDDAELARPATDVDWSDNDTEEN